MPIIAAAVGVGQVAGAGTTTKPAGASFGQALKASTAAAPLKAAPAPKLAVASAPGQAKAGMKMTSARATATASSNVTATAKQQSAKAIDHVVAAQTRMEQVLSLAQSGKTFTPGELLSMQTQVYRASQEIDLAGKVVEKATGGVKQVLQTQV